MSHTEKILALVTEAMSEWEQKHAANDWKVDKDSHGITISKSKIFTDKKRPICWKTEFIVEEDIVRVTKLFKEPETRVKWDKAMDVFKILETFSDEVSLTYTKSNNIGAISARDFTDATAFIIKKNEGDQIVQFKMVGSGIDLDQYPPEKKVVRGRAYSSGVQLDRTEVEGKSCTKVLFLNQTEINGWIPEAVVNAAMTSQLYQMAQNVRKKAKDEYIFA